MQKGEWLNAILFVDIAEISSAKRSADIAGAILALAGQTPINIVNPFLDNIAQTQILQIENQCTAAAKLESFIISGFFQPSCLRYGNNYLIETFSVRVSPKSNCFNINRLAFFLKIMVFPFCTEKGIFAP